LFLNPVFKKIAFANVFEILREKGGHKGIGGKYMPKLVF
jgi:hypothetical protein